MILKLLPKIGRGDNLQPILDLALNYNRMIKAGNPLETSINNLFKKELLANLKMT